MEDGEDKNQETNPDNSQDKNVAAKIVAGLGGLFAGAYIAKKLLKKGECPAKPRNPLLRHMGDKKKLQELVSEMRKKKEGLNLVSPSPRDYMGNLDQMSDPVQNDIFQRGLHARGEHRYHEAMDLFDKILPNLEGGDRAAMLALMGNSFYSEGMFKDALEKSAKAHEEALRADNREAEAACLGNMGITHLQMFSLDKARRYCEDALKIFSQLESIEDEADQLYNLAVIYRKSGEPDKALKVQEDALKIHRHRKDKYKEAMCLGNMGLIYQQKSNMDSALDCFEHALKLNTEIGNLRGEAEETGHIGGAFQQKGDLDTALKHEEDALAIHRKIGNQNGEANQLGNIGLIYQQRGEYDKALGYFGDALRIHKLIGNKMGEATGLVNIGIIYRKTGNLEKAMECQRDALKIFTQIGAKAQTEMIKQNIKKIHDMMVIRKVERGE